MTALDGGRLLSIVTSKYGAALSCIVLGALNSCGLAPVQMWPATIIAFVFFMMQMAVCKSKFKVFWLTILFFASYAFISLSWLDFVLEGFGQAPAVISYFVILAFACTYIALPYAILNVIAYKIANNRIGIYLCCFMPLAFIISDFFTGWFLTGFPWLYSGYSCVEGPLKNYAPFIGVRGISALIYVLSGAVAMTAMRKFLYLPIAAMILLIGVFLEGISFVKPLKALDVVMVQGNIPQEVNNDGSRTNSIIAKYWDLTKDHLKENRLIIWPESALPIAKEFMPNIVDDLNTALKSKKTELITGIFSVKVADRKSFNSIVSLGREQDVDDIVAYNKRALVPFGEIVPFADILRQFGSIFVIPNSSFSYGEDNQEPIKAMGLSFTPAICYEAIFPDLIRQMDSDKTQAIVMLSNDSWFGPTKAPVQHLNIARMRSMELNKPMLRDTNSGITAYINEKGEVVKTMPTDVEGVEQFDFVPVEGQSLFSKFGNLGLYLIMLILLGFGIYGRFAKRNTYYDQVEKLSRP